MKVNVYSIQGEEMKSIELPEAFNKEVRLDLIRRAVISMQSNRRQPYGASLTAGMMHSVEWWGKGRGVSRVPRLKDSRRAAEAPCTVGGRRAHPPKVEKIWKKKINRKEKYLSKLSALSATAKKEWIIKRGHKFKENITFPIVLEDAFERISKTKEIISLFEKLGIYDDVERARRGKRMRPGRGKMRGRRYRRKKSILIVITRFDGIEKGARNLPGIDVVKVSHLNTEKLAPGGDPGRLSLFSESAIEEIRRWKT